MIELSNAMADRAERVKSEWQAHLVAEESAVAHALAAGALLCEAREEVPHGGWAAFLERAGIHERQARRLMQLARSGLKSDTVSALGGVKAALAWLAGRKLPGPDEGLFITLGDEPASQPFVVVSRWREGFRLIMISPDHELTELKRPVVGPAEGVWMLVDHLVGGRSSEMSFNLLPDHDAWEAGMDLAA